MRTAHLIELDAADRPVPVAILTDAEVLQQAAQTLAEHDRLRLALRTAENTLRRLCRQYDAAAGTRGLAPYHLRSLCEARGLMPVARVGD